MDAKMKKVCVNIEWRKPFSRIEKKCYGVTTTRNPAIIDVFLRSNMTGNKSVETFFHEMTHVFFRCYNKHRKLPKGFEERMSSVIGVVASKILGA